MCLTTVPCVARADVDLLRDVDLNRSPRPEQFPDLRQRFDSREQSSLCPLLPLEGPGIRLAQ
jgi:hypothetical protein